MVKMQDVVVIDACRTPIGKARPDGYYANTRADDMVIAVICALMERNPQVKPGMINDNRWGATTLTEETGMTMGRATALAAGLGVETPGCALDRMCASGMTMIGDACHAIACGMGDIMIAGGVEHMYRFPMGYNARPNAKMMNAKLPDGSKLDFRAAGSMGLTAENVAKKYGITRDEQDQYSLNSQLMAKVAMEAGKMKDQIIPMEVVISDKEGNKEKRVVDTDEQPRPGTTIEKLGSLKPAFIKSKKKNGSVTAGNSSGLNDAAGGVLLMSADKAKELGCVPKMKFISSGLAGVDPAFMGEGPIPATRMALERAGLVMDDIGIYELNEAFASQSICNISELKVNQEITKVNPWGGSIAYGHPLGMSGARVVAFLKDEFADPEFKDVQYGITAMCVGMGQGYAIIWENLQK